MSIPLPRFYHSITHAHAPYDLRLLTEPDAKAFKALQLTGLREQPGAFIFHPETVEQAPLAKTRDFLAQNHVIGAFCATGGRLVGMVAQCGLPDKLAHMVDLSKFYVAAAHRGRGLGKSLMALFLDMAEATGKRGVTLSVVETNRNAIGLYERFGFLEYGRCPGQFFCGQAYLAGVHMHKPLPAQPCAHRHAGVFYQTGPAIPILGRAA